VIRWAIIAATITHSTNQRAQDIEEEGAEVSDTLTEEITVKRRGQKKIIGAEQSHRYNELKKDES
jgi:hypothetical protein